jgi:crotonobetainyl-CoA:carnitine CoA-transferase CaiB-like acyl-CoA transferase
VNTLADVFDDEHVRSTDIVGAVEHPTAGMVKMISSPVLLDGERPRIRRPPPTLGQHTQDEGWLR